MQLLGYVCLLLIACAPIAEGANEAKAEAELADLAAKYQKAIEVWNQNADQDQDLYNQINAIAEHRQNLQNEQFTVGRDLRSAIDRWNQEVQTRGPRQIVRSAFDPNGHVVGGPTPVTEALVNSLQAQMNSLTQAIGQDDAQLGQLEGQRSRIAGFLSQLKGNMEAADARICTLRRELNLDAPEPPAPANSSPAVLTGLDPRVEAALSVVTDWSKVMVIAEDGELLGTLSPSEVDRDSIYCPVGSGSKVGRTSIYNEVGQYGGEMGQYSPYNKFCPAPPQLYVNGKAVCFVTVNETLQPRIEPHLLKALPKLVAP